METDTTSTQEQQFVLRRLEEALQLLGREVDAHWFWIAVLVAILLTAFIYVGLMYRRDSHSVGWLWAGFLGLLRSTVYVILGAVFLLPAFQTWERNEFHSKVVLVHD